MLCDICKKNPATVHLTEIIDEQMNELHLCEDCARHKSAAMEQQFGLSDLLAGMADFDLLPTEGGEFIHILHLAQVQVPASTRADGELSECDENGEKWQEVVPDDLDRVFCKVPSA